MEFDIPKIIENPYEKFVENFEIVPPGEGLIDVVKNISETNLKMKIELEHHTRLFEEYNRRIEKLESEVVSIRKASKRSYVRDVLIAVISAVVTLALNILYELLTG